VTELHRDDVQAHAASNAALAAVERGRFTSVRRVSAVLDAANAGVGYTVLFVDNHDAPFPILERDGTEQAQWLKLGGATFCGLLGRDVALRMTEAGELLVRSPDTGRQARYRRDDRVDFYRATLYTLDEDDASWLEARSILVTGDVGDNAVLLFATPPRSASEEPSGVLEIDYDGERLICG
jgi:hypothetical protein